MTDVSNAADDSRGIGDNMPPEQTLKERIEEVYAEQFGQISDIADRANALPKEISTDTECGQVADIVSEAGKLSRKLEDLRKVEKEPFIRDGKIVDATFKENRLLRLENISNGLTTRITAFNRAKAAKARAEQQAAEKAAREAQEQANLDARMEAEAGNYQAVTDHLDTAHKAAAAVQEASALIKAAEVTRVVSDSGTKVTTRTEVKARVTDWQKVDLNALRAFIKPEHIEQALRQFVRINKKNVPIEGVEFYDDEVASVRS